MHSPQRSALLMILPLPSKAKPEGEKGHGERVDRSATFGGLLVGGGCDRDRHGARDRGFDGPPVPRATYIVARRRNGPPRRRRAGDLATPPGRAAGWRTCHRLGPTASG